ncbi:MAG: hypothetical protein KBS85_00925 [Lachnospiraceae bacterium]|nr:hypothetical protein [Candidatus Merdinaster equi]
MKDAKSRINKKVILFIMAAVVIVAAIIIAIIIVNNNSGNKNQADAAVTQPVNQNVKVVTKEVSDATADSEVDAESFTLMVYMCGSDLESKRAYATNSINQILASHAGQKLQIVIETGGSKFWKNEIVKNDALYRYEVSNNKLQLIGEAGNHPITDVTQLSDFIQFAAKEKPADRYGFVFWDHGGGTIGGYGQDKLFDSQSMDIRSIQKGFADAGIHFDFVGFDCCLMSTVEIANALKDNADYLIASEETEPGSSWYYTDALNIVEDNPGASIKTIAKQFISDFNSPQYTETAGDTTLALIDLSRMDEVTNALSQFMDSMDQMLIDGRYDEIAKARIEARSFGKDKFEQIDIIDYVNRIEGAAYKDELISAIENAVLYRESRSNDANGLAMYFPYYMLDQYTACRDMTYAAGFVDENYTRFYDDFVSIEVGGRGEGNNPYIKDEDEITDYSDLKEQSWYNERLVNQYGNLYTSISEDSLKVIEDENSYLVRLKDSDWDIISSLESQVYLLYDDGYLMLGSDDYVETTDDGDLVIAYDCNWLHMNGCIASYYAVEKENSSDYSVGYMPALLNQNEYIDIWVMWTEDSCELLGYTPTYDDVSAKGYFQFEDGDSIDFLFDFYTYDGIFEDSYLLKGNGFVYNGKDDVFVYYDEVGNSDAQVNIYIKDIYQNEYWTESVLFEGGN